MDSRSQPALEADIDREIVRDYYLKHSFFTSTEGILKVVSIVVCSALSLPGMVGGSCAHAAGGVTLAAALLLGLLSAAAALVPADCAPITRFYIDVSVSTAVGVALLVSGVLSVTLCGPHRALDYIHGPGAVVSGALVCSSGLITYMSVSKRWTSARAPAPPPRAPPAAPAAELDV